ncbi:MAG: hypothetical protein COB16_16805 [Rhodobacteraceae bacterium]|nr:MAG: hypothetical protein COB16_16805 [Paracoccaceae bacterium]
MDRLRCKLIAAAIPFDGRNVDIVAQDPDWAGLCQNPRDIDFQQLSLAPVVINFDHNAGWGWLGYVTLFESAFIDVRKGWR